METEKTIGAITWVDLTVPDGEGVRDFYKISPDDNVVRTGVCHQKGINKDVPSAWLMYVNVANLDSSLDAVTTNGGEIIGEVRKMGEKARYCIVKDPAGAYIGLFDHGE